MTHPENRIEVLIIGPNPSVLGGVASVVGLQTNNPFLRDKAIIHFLNTTRERPSSEWGKASPANLLLFLKTLLFLLMKLMRDPRIRLCHIHASFGLSFYKNLFFSAIARLAGKGIVFHLHSGKIRATIQPDSKIASRFNRWLLRICDAIIVLNSETSNLLREMGFPAERVFLVPNAVSLPDSAGGRINQKIEQLRKSGAAICLTVGAGIGIRKGALDLVKLAKMADDEGKNILFVVIGGWLDKEEESEVMREVERMRLQDRILFLGKLPRHEVGAYYRLADVCCLMSYSEGMPLSILEAMSVGCPIVTTPVGAILEHLEHGKNGFLIPVGDIRSAFTSISLLLDNPRLADKIGKENVDKVDREYSLERYAENLHLVYQTLLERKFNSAGRQAH